MSEINSQHSESVAFYHTLKDHPILCTKNLGVNSLKLLTGASAGASGAKLLQAHIQEYFIVIKTFPLEYPFKYIRGVRRNKNTVRDYGNYEIGTGLMLTNKFILTHLTQNIVTCYNYTICDYSYETEISICHKEAIPKQIDYPIVNNNKHPLYSYYEQYFNPLKTEQIETPRLDDITRYFMVEKCDGDLQGFIEGNRHNPTMLLEILNYVVLMIFHTLLLFDIVLGGYSHNDLGLRNILYVIDPYGSCDTYNRYIFNDTISIDVPTHIIIPKIWDYAYVKYQKADDYASYYNYLDDGSTPNYVNIEAEKRENDAFVILHDIDLYLRTINISDSIFNTLDLDSIRKSKTNTQAINCYFQQNPITNQSNVNNHIIHTFNVGANI